MADVTRKDKLVRIMLCVEHFGLSLIGQYPVVHVVAHHIGVERVGRLLTGHMQWFAPAIRDEPLVELPGAVGQARGSTAILVDKCA